MVKSHLGGWETISHKDTRQTQYHKGWKDFYDTHDCMLLLNVLNVELMKILEVFGA
jgi:hypothetical protein